MRITTTQSVTAVMSASAVAPAGNRSQRSADPAVSIEFSLTSDGELAGEGARDGVSARPGLPSRGEAVSEAEQARRIETQVNQKLSGGEHGVRLHRHQGTGRWIVQIVDDRGQVVHQMPPEGLLKAAARLDELTGVLFDGEM